MVRRLILAWVFSIGLVYVLTFGLWGHVEGLRALHLDIPAWASDTAFQAKALANLAAGVVMLAGGVGMFLGQRWGKPVTVAGLLCQMTVYVAELIIFRYLPTLGAAGVVIPLDMAIIYSL